MHPRYFVAAGAGSLMTLTLFYVMQALMAGEDLNPQPASRTPVMLSSIRVDPPLPPPVEPHFMELTQPLPKTPSGTGTGTPWIAEWPTLPPGMPPPDIETQSEQSLVYDGPLVLVSRPLPNYPAEAVRREQDGWVIVQFDVLANGRVDNVSVVESSNAMFEKSAIQAAKKYRFKPRMVEGVPQPSTGLRNRIVYRMERG